jgi:signal transduction histidine kinase
MNKIKLEDFFKKEFLVKQITWISVLFSFIFLAITTIEVYFSSKSYRDKLDAIINLNKDEYFNSIVLEDREGIKQHLQIIKQQYELDSASITFNNKIISTEQDFFTSPSFFEKAIAGIYLKKFSNDFETTSFVFTANYFKTILRKTLIPAIIISLTVLIFLILLTYTIFRIQMNKIQKMLIEPLVEIGNTLYIGDDLAARINLISSINEISNLTQALINYEALRKQTEITNQEIAKLNNQAALSKVAAQVSHDIRSPLAALEVATQDISSLPEDRRVLIRASISRMRDIANNLLIRNNKKDETKTENVLISSAIENIVTEKRMEYRSRLNTSIEFDLDSKGYGLFAKVEVGQLKRVLSNIINNSIEAFDNGGRVQVSLGNNEKNIILEIRDNGRGIPREALSRIAEKGATFGKSGGSGLGLYHAKSYIESWNGKFEIKSEEGKGTVVMITLPKTEEPKWFVKSLELKPNSKIVIIDDDSSIHQIWDGRFQSLNLSSRQISVVHISNPSDAHSWYQKNRNDGDVQFLIDFEFIGSKQNGLELIKELQIESKSILVTSRYEDEKILTECIERGIQLIPKNLSGYVPIKV